MGKFGGRHHIMLAKVWEGLWCSGSSSFEPSASYNAIHDEALNPASTSILGNIYETFNSLPNCSPLIGMVQPRMIRHINLSCLQILGLIPHLIFHTCDLTEMSSRAASIQEGEDDEEITIEDTIMPSIDMHGPITRVQQLNHQVNSFLCFYNNDSKN
jgi:hypothetical protein